LADGLEKCFVGHAPNDSHGVIRSVGVRDHPLEVGDRVPLLDVALPTLGRHGPPVDVADPRFVYLDGGSSSFVDGAFYDADNGYMIISLNGTAYHYCGLPTGVWSTFTTASSLGSFYNTQIKGHFDCRTGTVPQYQQ
jgi:hypothetical protein